MADQPIVANAAEAMAKLVEKIPDAAEERAREDALLAESIERTDARWATNVRIEEERNAAINRVAAALETIARKLP